jgi:hypothetical protein
MMQNPSTWKRKTALPWSLLGTVGIAFMGGFVFASLPVRANANCDPHFDNAVAHLRAGLRSLESSPRGSKKAESLNSQATTQLAWLGDHYNACGDSGAAAYYVLDSWSDLLSNASYLSGPLPGCGSVGRAEVRGMLAARSRVLAINAPPLSSDPSYSHVVALLHRQERSLSMEETPLPGLSDAEGEALVSRYSDELVRTEADAPRRCAPPPFNAAKNPPPGPTYWQTAAWLIDNLPRAYFGYDAGESISQSMKYDFSNSCSIGVNIETDKRPTTVSAGPFEPIYIVNAEARSPSSLGRNVFFGEGGKGTVRFKDVRLSSIKVMQEDSGSEGLPNALGFKSFQLAFKDSDSAERVSKALHRLAVLCGGKDDPF